MALKKLTQEEVDALLDECLNDVCYKLQTAIGQEDGGVAGMYFAEEDKAEAFKALFTGYLNLEYVYDNMED